MLANIRAFLRPNKPANKSNNNKRAVYRPLTYTRATSITHTEILQEFFCTLLRSGLCMKLHIVHYCKSMYACAYCTFVYRVWLFKYSDLLLLPFPNIQNIQFLQLQLSWACRAPASTAIRYCAVAETFALNKNKKNCVSFLVFHVACAVFAVAVILLLPYFCSSCCVCSCCCCCCIFETHVFRANMVTQWSSMCVRACVCVDVCDCTPMYVCMWVLLAILLQLLLVGFHASTLHELCCWHRRPCLFNVKARKTGRSHRLSWHLLCLHR